MSKHSKRNCSSAVFTAYERRQAAARWGSSSARLSKDSQLDFDCCSICLSVCVEPQLCVHCGNIFCKECILYWLVNQKNEIKVKQKLFEKKQKDEKERKEKECQMEQSRLIEKFQKTSQLVSANTAANLKIDAADNNGKTIPTSSSAAALTSNSNASQSASVSLSTTAPQTVSNSSASSLACFWGESTTRSSLISNPVQAIAQAKIGDADRSTLTTTCPQCNSPVRLKELVPVKFRHVAVDTTSGANSSSASSTSPLLASSASLTSSSSSSSAALITADLIGRSLNDRYLCSSCLSPLNAATKVLCIAACGHCICSKCEALIRKDGQCTDCSELIADHSSMKGRALIALRLCGTGFSAHGAVVVKSKLKPAFKSF